MKNYELNNKLTPDPHEGGESLDSFHGRSRLRVFKLKGLNKPWKAGGFNGIYATVEYGKEDWFHCGFDETFTDDRLTALFDMFKNSEENLWSGKDHRVRIGFDDYSSGGVPINPIIKELFLDI